MAQINWFAWLVLLVLAAVALFYFFARPVGVPGIVASPEELRRASFESQFARDFITYRDTERGFELKYPVGFGAQREPLPGVIAWFAGNSAENAGELIQVFALDDALTESLFQDMLAEVNAPERVVNVERTTVRSRTAYLVDLRSVNPVTGAPAVVKKGVYDCARTDGRRYIGFVAIAYPEALESDADMADYVLRTFKC